MRNTSADGGGTAANDETDVPEFMRETKTQFPVSDIEIKAELKAFVIIATHPWVNETARTAVILEPDGLQKQKSTDSNRGDLRPTEYIHKRKKKKKKESPQEGVGGRVKKKLTGRLAESLEGFRRFGNYEIMTQIVRERGGDLEFGRENPDFRGYYL